LYIIFVIKIFFEGQTFEQLFVEKVTYSLFTGSKQKWLFWRADFFPANQSLLNTFQMALIGLIKAGPPKKPLLF